MAKNKKEAHKEAGLSEVENALTRSEKFVEDNQKVLSIVVGVIVLIVAGYLSYTKLYIQPKEKEAQQEMFVAEQYFQKDSFNLAINGDGNALGFLDIIDDYGMTKVAKLANYYTGISYLHLGKFKDALTYLKKFDTDDILLAPITEGARGDAYLELGQTDKALTAYKEAMKYKNDFTTPVYMMKAGELLEQQKHYQQAVAIYQQLKENYPSSNEGRSIDKYIARAGLHLEN